MRELVGRKIETEYRGALKAAQTLEDAAAPLFLICRYCLLPDTSFARAKSTSHQKKAQGAILARLEELMGRVQEVLNLESCMLPDWIRDFARDFPELCQPAASLPGDPLGSVVGGGAGMEVIQAALTSRKVGDAKAPAVVEYRPSGRSAPTPEVAALGRRLMVRWLTSKTATIHIAAPGKLNRLSALRGELLPYYAQLQRGAPGKQDALQALLAVDWSGSMSGPKWLAVRAAAQAITLALRANGGNVQALLFAEDAWHAPDYSADVLFHDRLGVIDLTNADGEDTSFRWLPRSGSDFPPTAFSS